MTTTEAPAKTGSADPRDDGDTNEDFRGRRREMTGVVTSNKMQKTVVVQVTRRVRAPMFGKYVTRRVKYKAHTELEFNVGDTVLIVESRPMSKDKRWRVTRLIAKTKLA